MPTTDPYPYQGTQYVVHPRSYDPCDPYHTTTPQTFTGYSSYATTITFLICPSCGLQYDGTCLHVCSVHTATQSNIAALQQEVKELREELAALVPMVHQLMGDRSRNVHEEVCRRDDQGSERQALDSGRSGEGTTDVTRWPPRKRQRTER